MEFLNVLIPWWSLPLGLLVGFLVGVVLRGKFDLHWLAMAAYLLKPEDLGALARVVWDAGLIPTAWKLARFGNDPAAFVNYISGLASQLLSGLQQMDVTILRDSTLHSPRSGPIPVERMRSLLEQRRHTNN